MTKAGMSAAKERSLRLGRYRLIQEIIMDEGFHGAVDLHKRMAAHGVVVPLSTVYQDLRRMPEHLEDAGANSSLLKMDTLISELEHLKKESKNVKERSDIIMKIAQLHRQREQLFDLLFSRQVRKKDTTEKKKLPTSISFGAVEVQDGCVAVDEPAVE